MKCKKCGAEWSTNISGKLSSCPFCGESLDEVIPYQQAIDAFKIIHNRFGIDLYSEKQRLYGLINDILPNTSKEKNILKTVISLGVPGLIATIITQNAVKADVLAVAYDTLERGGLDNLWCAVSIYIVSSSLEIDSTDLYPIENAKKTSQFDVSSISTYNDELEEEYASKNLDDLLALALSGDAIAATELGERYYTGNSVDKDMETAVAYFTQAADAGYPVAEFILGKFYDEGQVLPHNPTLAFEYYKKAADKDYPLAQYALGQMYYFGKDCEKNDSEALYWILKSADILDDSDVYTVLAMIYKESEEEDIQDDKKAFFYAQKAADMEDENAYNLLGTFYEMGCGTEQDYAKAIHYYRLAAENGVETAYLNLGAFYQMGVGVPVDGKKAVEYYQYGANAGNMYCLNALGMCYKNGIGVKQDYKKSFELFLDAALAGNFAGEMNVALAYDEGHGVEEDKTEAKRWFALAAEHGSSKAMMALGIYTEKGIPDGSPDLEGAFEWYVKAAEVGDHPEAMWIVGNCYCNGLMGVAVDKCAAFEWYHRAAELGHPTSQNNIACDYLRGEIIDLDYPLAVEWFEKAVAQKDMYALDNYGTIMLNGDGIPRDATRAFNMIKKSAELGYPTAQGNLGICYFEGWGTERNLDAALKWLITAYNAGVEFALEYLQKGFKEKNGTWVKRGLFGHVPAPSQLPPVSNPPSCNGGCQDFCEYVNMSKADKLLYDTDVYCYCELMEGKVFKKTKCPYYKDGMSDLIKAMAESMK